MIEPLTPAQAAKLARGETEKEALLAACLAAPEATNG
jgi:hypothetical protein